MAQKKAHDVHDRERTEDIHIDENVDFERMYLSELVLSGLKASGFVRPSPIQLAAIPLGRCGLDLIVQAKSGTGKTCVFTVVALEMVSVSAATTQVLVLAPTREIAVQVTQVINSIGSKMPGLRASTFIGGMHLSLDKVKLQCCHIAVGTPGRITQLIEMGLLRLNNVRLLVLDEADQLLTGQFADGIAHIATALPLNKQVIALSATYTDDIAKVAEGLMRSPNHVRLGKDSPALLGVDQYVKLLPYHRQPHRRQQAKFLELMNIICKVTFNQCLVFSNSQFRAESVCNKLRAAGWPASFLTGGQAQKDRLIALDDLCSYKCRILVSTDLSARGLDSEHVNLVINLDMPRNHATYLHRVGRAGRFGSRGSAISLATEGDEWCAMRAISSMANVRVRLLKNELTVDIAEKDEENQEYVEMFTEDELALYLNVSSTDTYVDSQKDKAKRSTDSERKGKSETKLTRTECEQKFKTAKNITEDCNGRLSEEFCHGKRSERVKCSKGDSKQRRKLEMEKKIQEENAEQNARNLCEVVSVLKKVSLDQLSSNVSFDNIMAEVSEHYSTISAEDNPSICIPTSPGTFKMCETDEKAIRAHWKIVEEDLQEVIHHADKSCKDLSFTFENALQAKVEGEKTALYFGRLQTRKEKQNHQHDAIKSLNGDLPDKGKSEMLSSSSSESNLKLKEDVEVGAYRLSSKYKQRIVDTKNGSRMTNGRERKNRRNRDVVEGDGVDRSNFWNYNNIDPQTNYQDYGNAEERDSHGCYADYRNNDWYTYAGGFHDVRDGFVSQKGTLDYENYVRNTSIMHHKYLDRIERFTAMVDYVQTMGRISSWIARDYHLGL